MKRILLFCPKDWNDPRAGSIEDYVHEVFARIASEGHYIAWICQAPVLRPALDLCAGAVDIVDGIQVVRMGVGPLHRWMAKSLVLRLAGEGDLERKYDAIVECVDGQPQLTGLSLPIPVIPLVFRFSSRFRAAACPQRMWIAATKTARLHLFRLGLPEHRCVLAPFGVNHDLSGDATERAARPLIVGVMDSPRPLERAMRHFTRKKLAPDITIFSRKRRASGHPRIQINERGGEKDRFPVYRSAWVGYCGAGHESEALRMAACGVPVISANSVYAREFIAHGKTGLLVSPWRPGSAAAALARLLSDELARRRWGAEAKNRCRALSWDRTARIVWEAILDAIPGADVTDGGRGRFGDPS